MAISVTCLCGDVALSVQLDPTTDHTQLQLCHCNSCRAVTGLLCSSYYLMQDEPPALNQLQEYQESPHVSRFFCKNCGAHVFAMSKPSGRYLVASGVLVEEDAPAVRSIQHWKTGDTGDGGLSAYLPGWPSTDLSCRLEALSGSPEQSHSARRHTPPEMLDGSQNPNKLQARCHCGGIEFYVTPPDASSTQAWSQWCDLLVPYNSGHADLDNEADVKWFLRAENTKYLAGTCACTSCRLNSGFPIQVWAFIPKSNLFQVDGSPLTFDRGTMRQYRSSPGVYREFCNRCGAMVFWHNDGRPTLIDVSAGLIQGGTARSEELLDWATGRVSFGEMAVQKDLVKLLEDGMQQYAQQ
ncbi:uncharacterized protein N7482_005431 [Penicillium canariense]|uniref:CENP-V/GFA domain-containing protein n=1 Tax=Penicillium canariense TaxID=189055 RepID=A0A9W9I2D7_9EURO|nr:uncharacterized protein N7482_005431 [Penicillium canariense]KAJ5166650.1 hypothetical protein N7482_005431 [Penicillium canariense]